MNCTLNSVPGMIDGEERYGCTSKKFKGEEK